jgi:Spy/CpxP family protein refolding chaperone
MKRRVVATFLLLSLTFAVANLSAGAEAAAPLPTEITRIELLQNQSVQKELKLTDVQAKKIKEAFVQHQEEMKDVWQTLPPNEASGKWHAMRKDLVRDVLAVLDAGQRHRLWQIDFQSMNAQGWDSFTFSRTDVAKMLGLTNEQTQRLKAIQAETSKKNIEIFQSKDRSQFQKKMDDLRKGDREQVAAVLSDEQKKKWRDWIGTAFVVRMDGGHGDLQASLKKWIRDNFGAAQSESRKTGKPIFALFRCEP